MKSETFFPVYVRWENALRHFIWDLPNTCWTMAHNVLVSLATCNSDTH